MFSTVSLYMALSIFAIGLLYKVSTWFRYNLGPIEKEISFFGRMYSAINGIFLTLFSKKILTLVNVFVLDVVLQKRTFKQSLFRWLMHMCIFWGFMWLLLMHALEKFISAPLFLDYSSTLNPFLSLRNVAGILVIVGVAMAVYRRSLSKKPRLKTNLMDRYAITILAVIMLSGVFLEATKIVSYSSYQSMVEDYANADDEEALKALESYWVKEFGIASPHTKGPFDGETLVQGKALHEESCAACHSRPQWAPLSYGVSRIIKPVAVGLDKAGASAVLWYIHFFACLMGLTYLPFSKMFHIFASPLSLLANAAMNRAESDSANIATRQVMELDACTHCGNCSLQCSVGVTFEEMGNLNILPSEKMTALKALAAGKALSEKALKSLLEGLYLCTNCYRCTVACPVGINLQDLWFNVREALFRRGLPELLILSPFSLYRGLNRDEIDEYLYMQPLIAARRAISEGCRSSYVQRNPIDLKDSDREFRDNLRISTQGGTYSYCFTCTTCSTACPVVQNFENPREVLGLLPHQIIRAAALGLPEMVYQSDMLWACLSCYQCQEHCPQGVRVTDVLYEIKNAALKHVNGKRLKG
ncbi:MAG: 4Fe-4S dicluster domain-containing protein [Deltaproteobacteria bacterium]|nr:MAG: 4Fe-4S dicluster domain-containing protein [Deltaproteobacteria bacterium]